MELGFWSSLTRLWDILSLRRTHELYCDNLREMRFHFPAAQKGSPSWLIGRLGDREPRPSNQRRGTYSRTTPSPSYTSPTSLFLCTKTSTFLNVVVFMLHCSQIMIEKAKRCGRLKVECAAQDSIARRRKSQLQKMFAETRMIIV